MRNDFITLITESFQGNLWNSPVFVVILVWICIQWTKIIIDYVKTKHFNLTNIFVAWWFPSTHSGLATSVTTIAIFEYWFFSSVLAITITFAFLVGYDAMNVRFQAGEQARYINSLRRELGWVLDTKKNKIRLKERMWHTPIEVFGGVLFGFVLTTVFYMIFIIH